MSAQKQISFLTADWGNRLLKQMIAGQLNTISVMENSLLDLSESAWANKVERYKHRPSDFNNTEMFAVRERHPTKPVPLKKGKWLPVIVGDAAKNHGRPRQQTGEVKYRYEYFGKIACANFLRMFPNGNDNIVLQVGHPASSIGQVTQMLETVTGRHEVMKVDGSIVTFTVVEAIPSDEPNGGIICYLSGEGAYNPNQLDEKDLILVVDVGGGVTSLTQVLVDRSPQNKIVLIPIYEPDVSPSFNMGIRNVMNRLSSELKQNHVDFKDLKDISDKMLEEGIATNSITLYGDKVDVTQEVLNSTYILLDPIESVYAERLGKGAPFKLVVLTGGGSKSLYNGLISSLDHPYIVTATDIERLYLGNLLGMDEIFRQWIKREVESV